MARGNDAADARRELEGRLGTELNAEELIEANRKRYSPELRAALQKRVDVPATEALSRKAVAAAVKEYGELIEGNNAYRVRGDQVIALYHDDTGRVEKAAVPLDEVKGARKAKKAKQDPDKVKVVPDKPKEPVIEPEPEDEDIEPEPEPVLDDGEEED